MSKPWVFRQTFLISLAESLAKAVFGYGAKSQKLFGGLCYMINGNMTICISKRGILARVGPETSPTFAGQPGVRAMEMRGKIMPGYLWLNETAVPADASLAKWVKRCFVFAGTLPAKAPKAKKTAKKSPRRKP